MPKEFDEKKIKVQFMKFLTLQIAYIQVHVFEI